jgi:hypothetical protein
MSNQNEIHLSWQRWWRKRRQWLKLRSVRTCTNCGFLAFGDNEADAASRIQLCTEGKYSGLPEPVEKWRCARKLWKWELDYVAPNWEAVLSEANADRRGCPGFFRHSPGRSPAEHLQLENGATEFRRKLMLGLLPLLYASIGGVVGWFLRRWLH